MPTIEVPPLTQMATEKRFLNEGVAAITITMLLEMGVTLAGVKYEWMKLGMGAEEADGYINRWLYAEET